MLLMKSSFVSIGFFFSMLEYFASFVGADARAFLGPPIGH
jgi:hypothetical protein